MNALLDMETHELLAHAREHFTVGEEIVYMYTGTPVLIGEVVGAPYVSDDGAVVYVPVEVRWQNSNDFPHWPDDGYNVRYMRLAGGSFVPEDARGELLAA